MCGWPFQEPENLRMSVTITELAKELNVSHSTVSRVLNGHAKGFARPEIAERIRELARERGYAPNISARTLKTGKSGIVGLVIGEISERFSGCYAQALLNEAEKYGFRLILSTTNYGQERERKCLEDLLRFHVDGVIYPLFFDPENELYRQLKERAFPLITNPGNHDFSSVGYDYGNAFRAMCMDFLKRGHHKVTLLTWPFDHHAEEFREQAAAVGLEVEELLFQAADRYGDALFVDLIRRGSRAVYTHSFSELRNLLRVCEAEGAPKPDCACTYTLPFEYVADPAVIGAVIAPLRERVEAEIRCLVSQIADSAFTPQNDILACEYHTHAELEILWKRQIQDVWYKNYR